MPHGQGGPGLSGNKLGIGSLLAEGNVAPQLTRPEPLGLLGVVHPAGRRELQEAPQC